MRLETLVAPLALVYEQAGSLVFFLVNRRGEDGRRALIEALRDYYRGRTGTSGWEALGFDEPEELDAPFQAFLEEVGR